MDDTQQMIDDCIERQSKLTDWEVDFIDSLQNHIADHPATARQREKLTEIWERVTNER